MLSSLEFLQPAWLFAMALPLLCGYYRRCLGLQLPPLLFQQSIRFPALNLLRRSTHESGIMQKNRSYRLLIPVSMLLLLALAQPVLNGKTIIAETTTQAVDVVLAVNTSVSMVLKDFLMDDQPASRMDITRRLLLAIAQKFEGERLALVIQGRPPAIWIPLTRDRQVLSHALTQLKPVLGGRLNDPGETLLLVDKMFSDAVNDAVNHKQIVLLIHDGYSQLGGTPPQPAIDRLSANGIQMHTIAVGTLNHPEHLISRGDLIYRPVDLELLQSWSDHANGRLFHLDDSSRVDIIAHELLSAISVPEKTLALTYQSVTVLYPYPLFAAMLLLIVGLYRPGVFNQQDSPEAQDG